MRNNHQKTRLKANSSQIGERCPTSGTVFEAGDEVVICQESSVAFSAKHWPEAVSMWDGHCPYCDSDLAETTTPYSPTKSKPSDTPPRRQVSLPIWVMIAGGITLLLVGILCSIGAYNLIVTEDETYPLTATAQVQLTSTAIAEETEVAGKVSDEQAKTATSQARTATVQAEELSGLVKASEEQAKTATAQVKTATAVAKEIAQNEAAARDAAESTAATAQARATATAKAGRTATAQAKTAAQNEAAAKDAAKSATATAQAKEMAAAEEKESNAAQTITCSNEPRGIFKNIWARYKDRLGCPHQTEPIGGFWAEQPFQNGHMFWSKDAQLYLVTIGESSGTWQLFPEDNSIWNEGMPQLSCNVQVPSGLVQPVRGFGGIWCTHSDIREPIGWGTDVERGFENGIDFIQGFEDGVIFRDSDGHTRGLAYVMFWDDTSFVKENY